MSNETPIQVTRAMLPTLQDYIETIRPIWDSHKITNHGVLFFQFKKALSEYLGVADLALCANGHLALESVLQALQLRGEVITTPFTFISTTNAIIRCGLTPVFCDIKNDNYTLDPAKLERCITPNTAAILPVHVFGNLCDTEAIERIAAKYQLPVVYDAAHAFGVRPASSQDENVLMRGTASVVSFHATKVFNSVEGGAVISKDAELLHRVFLNTNYGLENSEISSWIGGNAKMSELHAAMGLCNLSLVGQEISCRKRLSELYYECLSSSDKLVLPTVPKNVFSNYAYYPVVFRDGTQVRDSVLKRLAQKHYHARRYFYPLTCDHPMIQKMAVKSELPVARAISAGVLCLPLYGDLADKDVLAICEIILSVISE